MNGFGNTLLSRGCDDSQGTQASAVGAADVEFEADRAVDRAYRTCGDLKIVPW